VPYLAGIVPTGGITGNLDVVAYNELYNLPQYFNQFREIGNGTVGANRDANGDKVSDIVADVGLSFSGLSHDSRRRFRDPVAPHAICRTGAVFGVALPLWLEPDRAAASLELERV
jgi:hypothetical protein